jgi:hypothetical protein
VTVTNGRATFAGYADVIHAGLAYESELETLTLDRAGVGDFAADKDHVVSRVTAIVEETNSLWAGIEGRLDEYRVRDQEDYDEPTIPVSGRITVNTSARWGNGRVVIAQKAPLPCKVLGIVPSGMSPIGMEA